MHELFTTAVVPDAAVFEVLKILQGLCAMTPVHQFERRLMFEGPKTNPLSGIPPSLLPGRKRENEMQWRELHKQLVRQSYYMAVSYEVKKTQFGQLPSQEVESPSDRPVYVIVLLPSTSY